MQTETMLKNPMTNHLMKSNGVDPKLIEPEGDFRGLDPTYIKKEGERAYFVAALQTVLAVHLSYLSIAWLAWQEYYVDGAVGVFIASWLWSRVIANVRYAWNCNLEADDKKENAPVLPTATPERSEV